MTQRITAKTAAQEIYSQMSEDDRGAYVPADWAEGIDIMCQGDWEHLDPADIALELEAILEAQVCPHCGQRAEYRVCWECGKRAIVIDCGHYQQPAVIAGGKINGGETEHYFCSDCAEM